MLHRVTWVAAPVVGLIVVGAGLGWWGYNQNQQRQSLAVQAENQYASSFHGLVSDVHVLHQELGKSMITSDASSFQTHLRNVWRLSYAAQTQVARLPFQLMPMHNTQSFLTNVSQDASKWMDTGASPKDPSVHRSLSRLFTQSNQMYTSLSTLQTKVMSGNLHWLTANQALLASKHEDNQIVDGFHTIDKAATAYVESENGPTSTLKRRTDALSNEQIVSSDTAIRVVRRALQLPSTDKLTVTQTGKGAKTPEYVVRTSETQRDVFAIVSKHGGHLISFQEAHPVSPGNYDVTEAESAAAKWLQSHGFKSAALLYAHTMDSEALLTFAPVYQGATVSSQGIAVTVSMPNQQIVGFDANNDYYHPIGQLPPRRFSIATLRAKLNATFKLGETKEVIVTDEQNGYQPAVAFYGVSNRETYCIYMNANTGREMYIEQLTQH